MLGLVKKISVGICGDAEAAARRARRSGSTATARSPAHAQRASARLDEVAAREGARGRASSTAGRTRRIAWSVEVSDRAVARMHPRQMLRELETAMPEDAMVSTDIGNICSVSNSYLRFEQPR